jgi:hypothetical protein
MPTRQRAGRSEGQRSWIRRPNPLAPTNSTPARPRGPLHPPTPSLPRRLFARGTAAFPVAWTIYEYLLRRLILSTGGAFLGRSPQRTEWPIAIEEQWAPRTPASPSLARNPGGLRSQSPRYGIHRESGPVEREETAHRGTQRP